MRARIATALAAFLVVAGLFVHAIMRQAGAQFADPTLILQTLEGFYGTGVLGSASRINASSGNVAAVTATATLAAVAAKTNYLTKVDINGGGATAGSIINCAITGLVGGTADAQRSRSIWARCPSIRQFARARPTRPDWRRPAGLG